jgi:hypothetical protein
MVISNSKNYIFFHPPKSGGSSVTIYLSNEALWNDIIIGVTKIGELYQNFYSPKYKIFKHTSPQELINVIGLKKYRSYFKFIVVRNPVERFVSTYNFFKDSYDKKVEWFLKSCSLELIDSISTFDYFIESSFVRKTLQKNVLNSTDIEKCIIPQIEYFDDEEMNAGRFAFFRLEDLNNSCTALITNKIMDSLYKFEAFNSSTAKIKNNDLDSKKINIISNYYKIDLEKFGYQL